MTHQELLHLLVFNNELYFQDGLRQKQWSKLNMAAPMIWLYKVNDQVDNHADTDSWVLQVGNPTKNGYLWKTGIKFTNISSDVLDKVIELLKG